MAPETVLIAIEPLRGQWCLDREPKLVCALCGWKVVDRRACLMLWPAGTHSGLCASIRYQDYQAEQIPIVEQDGAKVRVMAGKSHGVTGPIAMRNPGLLLDVTVAKGATFSQEVRD